MEQLEFALGGGLPALGDLHQRFQEAGLVDAVVVERGAAAQAGDSRAMARFLTQVTPLIRAVVRARGQPAP